MGLFKKDDIRDYDLVSSTCCGNYLSERGFQFLVEWDPTSLIQTDHDGWLPLHWIARTRTSIVKFTIVFGYRIRYYLYKKGIYLLFRKDNDGEIPFQTACQNYGRDECGRGNSDSLSFRRNTLTYYRWWQLPTRILISIVPIFC